MRIKAGNCMRGGVMSLTVTSGGTYWIWWESWLLPGHNPGETPGTIQAVHRDLEREQGLTGRWVIVSRMVTHRQVLKTMTYVDTSFNQVVNIIKIYCMYIMTL